MKGATSGFISSQMVIAISIHAPREGGDSTAVMVVTTSSISIHAPREGGDYFTPARAALTMSFQSTPPVKGATTFDIQVDDITGISIHAPREGGDPTPIHITNVLNYFNPRPP